MLVAKSASIYLRLRVLLVAGLLAVVAGGDVSAQDASPTEDAPAAANGEAAEYEAPTEDGADRPTSGSAEDASDKPAPDAAQDASDKPASGTPEDKPDAAAKDSPEALPPIEVTQPAKKEPAPAETVKPKTPRVVSTQPAGSQTTTYDGTADGEGLVGLGGGEAKGNAGDGTGGETAWGPVDGFVATRSASGIKTDTPILEIPQSVSVITADRIEQLGANSLNDALGYTAGVRSSVYGSDSRYDWLSIRGFDAYFPGFYFDGLFARNNNTWAVWKVEPYGAERIEVLKGPGSVLYGQMSPGGLINVITKRPTEESFHEVEMQIGTYGRAQPAFDMGGPLTEDGKVLYRVTGLGLQTDTQVDFVHEDRFYLAPAVTFKPSADTSLTILAHYLTFETGVTSNFLPPQGTLLPNPNGQIPRSFFSGDPNFDGFDHEQWAVTYLLEHQLNETWQLRQNARYGSLDLDFVSLYGTGLDPFDPTERTLARNSFFTEESVDQFVIDNQAEARFATGGIEHTMLFGADYQWNKFNQTSGDGLTTPIDMFSPDYGGFFGYPPLFAAADTYLTQTGIYAQEQAKLFDRLVLVAGGRYDWAESKIDDRLFGADAEQKDEAFTWRAGAIYETPSGIAPYFSYATSFLPVSGFDPLTGNPFDPETGRQYEAGIKIQPPGRRSLMTFSAFDITRQNYLTTDNLFNQRQTGEIMSRGLEFETVAELADGLDLIAAYTWLPDFTITKSSDPLEVGKREPTVPEHWGSLWAHYQFQQGPLAGFGFGGGVRYIGETYGDSINSALMVVPSITLLDAMVDYESGGWRFAVNAHNLEDKTYVASCWDTCYYGEGRTVIGTITRRW